MGAPGDWGGPIIGASPGARKEIARNRPGLPGAFDHEARECAQGLEALAAVGERF